MECDARFEIEEVISRFAVRMRRLALEPSPRLDAEDVRLSISRSESFDHPDLASYDSIEFSKSSVSSLAPPPWSIGFSKQFKKDTTALDRKMMGRILEVLEELSEYAPPFHAEGDTFKPLKGELAGCWRYRIGDSRLVIQPQKERAQINAVAFASRGSVYD